MEFLDKNCSLTTLNRLVLEKCQEFSCNHTDLDDFFKNDVQIYSDELFGKSYCFLLDEDPSIIVCAFTISNDSIKVQFLPEISTAKIRSKISNKKTFKSFPAVLIGRLGVNKDFKKQGIGCELMEFIKSWFIDKNNKTGCRFVVVDAYNKKESLNYYLKNGFQYVFSTKEEEKKYMRISLNSSLRTRLMYFDLICLSPGLVDN